MRQYLALTIAVLTLVTGMAGAADFGKMTVDGETLALTSACAFVPRFDMQGWGKPEVTILLSSVPLDCTNLTGWANPESGAFDVAVKRGEGALLSVSFQPGLKPGKVSVYGVGYTLGNDDCEGCQAQAAYAGAGLKGAIKTTKPLKLTDTAITFDVHFDMPKPAAAAPGEKLVGGGDPGKAYIAYIAAYRDGDYEALKKLLPEGEAEDKWGYYETADERRDAVKGDDKPKFARILEGWRQGASAVLIVEVPHPWSEGEKVKAVVGLGFDGTSWRVREERVDFGGTILGR